MAAASQALITYCLWFSFKVHTNEASTAPPRIFQRLSSIVVIRGAILTVAQLALVILYLARPDRLWWTPIHQILAPLYYASAIATLNMRGKPRFERREDLEMVKEPLRDSVLGLGVFGSAPSATTDDPFMNYINYVRHPAPALDVHLVQAGRPADQGDGAKELHVEPREQFHPGLGVIPSVNENTRSVHVLEPNRLKEDISLSSVTSKETEGDITDAPEEGTGTCHPRISRQLLRVPKPRGGSSLKAESSLWYNLLNNLPTLKAHAGNAGLANLTRKLTLALGYSQRKPLVLAIDLLRSGLDTKDSIRSFLDNDALSGFVTRYFHITLPLCRELTIKCSPWLDMEILTGLVEGYVKHNQNTFPTLEFSHTSYNPTDTIEVFAPPHALPLWRTGGVSPLIMIDDIESTTPSRSPLPSLKNFTIDNITHEWSLLPLSGLHIFRLRNIPSDNSPPYTEIRRLLLSNAETLTTLELSNISISDVETVSGRFTLPHVKSLTIGFAHPRDLVWASQTLDLPALEELVVEDHTGGSESEQMFTTYREMMRCFPLDRIRRLGLRCVMLLQTVEDLVPLHESDRSLFLTRFKNVKDLEVLCPEFLISKLLSLFSRLGEY
ncbi:hypothetical protein PQX77_006262 [Marasmius sp. AFHP31]|nr:hypothetical protein PQX77_006262 [Marasmius sp. AFHP31]